VRAAGGSERLPHSVSGLLGFALNAWLANAPLFIALALGVFAAYSLVEYIIPAAAPDTHQGELKLVALSYAGLFADALVIAAVAVGVAACAAGAPAPPRTLVGVAIERWLPVIAVSLLADAITQITSPFGGLHATAVPRAALYVTALPTWILWGILSLSGPFVALGTNRGVLSVIVGFGRAFAVSLQRENLVPLCVLAVVNVLPAVLGIVLKPYLEQHGVAHSIFWANAPVDAITIGPVSAIATAFALDFARRAGLLEEPKPPAGG
jgi:hypothetical protein